MTLHAVGESDAGNPLTEAVHNSFVRKTAVVATLLLTVAAGAQAQAAPASRFSVNAGVAMPMGDFGDAADMGFGVGGAYAFQAGKLNLRVNADWTRHSLSDLDGSRSQLGAMVNAIFPIADKGFYAIGGLGFYSQTLDIDGLGSDSESDLAYNAGVGYGKGKWFVEAKYRSVLSDDATNSLPITFGWKF